MISRRDLIATTPAAAAAAILPAGAAAAQHGDPEFAAKLAAYRRAEEAVRIKEAEIEGQLADMPPEPVLPPELREPFAHPTVPGLVHPSAEGWTAQELAAIAQKMEFSRPEARWLYREPIWSPIRRKAGDLLRVRLEFDKAHACWRDACDALQESCHPFLGELDACVDDVLMHPVSTLEDLAAKAEVAKAQYAWCVAGSAAKMEAVVADVLRLAAGGAS